MVKNFLFYFIHIIVLTLGWQLQVLTVETLQNALLWRRIQKWMISMRIHWSILKTSRLIYQWLQTRSTTWAKVNNGIWYVLYIVVLLFLTIIQTWTIRYFWKTTLVLDREAILQYHQKEEAILKSWLITLHWTFIGTFQTYLLCLFYDRCTTINHLSESIKMYNDVIVTILTSTWLIWTSWETSSLLMFGRIWMLDTCR